jgi:hypothetical protein
MATEMKTTKPDWGLQATDTFVGLIDTVKTKTTGPLLKAVRALVYGLVIAVVGVVALIFTVIGLIRLINSYLPGDVWAAHLLLGGVFTLAGLVLWAKRTP